MFFVAFYKRERKIIEVCDKMETEENIV